MKVITLLENKSNTNLEPKHGLCLYIETQKHKILFDLGPDDTFIKNAKLKGIDLSKVDTVIISHGHVDHGGGLKAFLKINKTATIYMQKTALNRHYVKVMFLKWPVGIDNKLIANKQIKTIEGNYAIDDELYLFTTTGNKLPSPMNSNLLKEDKKPDDFVHEHNLIIKENKNLLIMGCSHKGVINILESCPTQIDICIGGFHISDPITNKNVDEEYMNKLIKALEKYDIEFYTCHCTGTSCFNYLSKTMNNIKYLSCGMELNL